ncbi:Uncharacterised protein [Vibrio cholerae]|nr:Uncharacterised protein [Vibrio cholerae]CSB90485.1 Uncharacterised protein [Vibrio cholerae]
MGNKLCGGRCFTAVVRHDHHLTLQLRSVASKQPLPHGCDIPGEQYRMVRLSIGHTNHTRMLVVRSANRLWWP